MEKLSIVIPAYNAAGVIERCLDSILDQDYHNEVEIIVVNDGSTDNTAEILARYDKQYPGYFRIISKENGGVSSARNAGMDVALGDWIWFCDADDYIKKNSLSYVMDNFVDSNIDICTFSSISLDPIALKNFRDNEDQIEAVCYYDGSSLSGYKMKSYFFVWNRIFRLKSIQDIRFRNMAIGEDVFFNLEAFRKDLRLRCTNADVYRYTVSASQLTRKRDPESMRKAIRGYEQLFEYSNNIQEEAGKEDHSLHESIKEMIAGQFTPFMSRVFSAKLKTSEFIELIDRLRRNKVFPIKELDKKCIVYNFIGNHPYLYSMMSFLHRKLIIPYVLPKLSRN